MWQMLPFHIVAIAGADTSPNKHCSRNCPVTFTKRFMRVTGSWFQNRVSEGLHSALGGGCRRNITSRSYKRVGDDFEPGNATLHPESERTLHDRMTGDVLTTGPITTAECCPLEC